jgi:hypothetical protein
MLSSASVQALNKNLTEYRDYARIRLLSGNLKIEEEI